MSVRLLPEDEIDLLIREMRRGEFGSELATQSRLLEIARWAVKAQALLLATREGFQQEGWFPFLALCNQYGIDEDLAPRDALAELCIALLADVEAPNE